MADGLCLCGCGEPAPISPVSHRARGWIKGQPLKYILGHTQRGRGRPLAERFWDKVARAPGDACWEWTGRTHARYGYGSLDVCINGRSHPRHAHRIAWEITHGPIPDELFVCHRCDNRKCVRPDHLFLGTTTDNIRDATIKGRIGNQYGRGYGPSKFRPRKF